MCPAPVAAQLEGPAQGFAASAQLLGEDSGPMAKAVAGLAAQALSLFLAQAMVLPGIPAALDPITGSGATAGPGRLAPPPAGGPGASQLEGIAQGLLSGEGIRGEDSSGLAKAAAGVAAQGVALFCAQSIVLPGIACAGFVTAAPGMLAPAPLASALEGIAAGLLQQNGIRGENAADLAKVLAQTVDLALTQFATMALVSPGIAAAPGATAAPGRLM